MTLFDCSWCWHGRGVHGETTMDGDVPMCSQCVTCKREAAERIQDESSAD